MRAHDPSSTLGLRLGDTSYDLTHRALVMGILNRTTDSFFAPAATFGWDEFFARAEQLVDDGADILDVGGVKAGPGVEVSEDEELERVVPAIGELRQRFDVALSVDTWRASVARECFNVGAVIGNDISGFADENYLAVAALANATVVATHIRLRPRVADPTPHYDNVTETVRQYLVDKRDLALASGIASDRIIVDAGLDLGKTAEQSLQLLRDSSELASLGAPLLLSASNKTFLGVLFDLDVGERGEASLAALSLGVVGGCRILRVHDVRASVRARDVLEQISLARMAVTS